MVVRAFELLGKPTTNIEFEFEYSYFVDFYSDRAGPASRQAGVAAIAAVSPIAAAAFDAGGSAKANGVVYVIVAGRVNDKPFKVRIAHLHSASNDPAGNFSA